MSKDLDWDKLDWRREIRDGRLVEVAGIPEDFWPKSETFKPDDHEYLTNESTGDLLSQMHRDLEDHQDFHDRVVAELNNRWEDQKQKALTE